MASKAKDWNATAPQPTASACPHLSCLPWRKLEDEVQAWDELARNAAEPNPFFESWYLLPSLRNLGDTDNVLILRYEENGRLAGLLPVIRNRRYYRWPVPQIASWLHPNAFCGAPLVAKGCEAGFWREVLRWADKEPGLALFLHFRGLPSGGPLHSALEDVKGERRQAVAVHREARAMLSSDLSVQDYLDTSLTGKKRKELRRQSNRLADEGEVNFTRQTDADGIKAWCEAFLALEAAGWKGKAGSALASAPGTSALFRESLAGAARRGRLERLMLSLDGRPIAMLATFLTPPGAYSYKTAFDEDYARFSPGVLLQRENLAMLDHPEIAWTDSCAAADHPMIDHLWRERRGLCHVSVALGGPLRRTLFRYFVRAEITRSPAGPQS